MPKPKKSKAREWVDALVFAVIVSTLVRGLLFSAYAIPSGSMEGTELTGDYLFVSKFSYGARMPITPLSVPFMEPVVQGSKPAPILCGSLFSACPDLRKLKREISLYSTNPAKWLKTFPLTAHDADQALPGNAG